MHRQNERGVRDVHYRRKILYSVIRKLAVESWINRMRRGGAEQEDIAVGRRFRDDVGADDAVGTGAIVDDEGLPEAVAELLADQPRDDVCAATGCEWNDDSHGFLGIGLRMGGAENGAACADCERATQHERNRKRCIFQWVFPGTRSAALPLLTGADRRKMPPR